ncbi:hypothetical protein H5410_056237 [Solanum commersonii]|uniref:Uncharacterized protein n=1 Tax=Solanum commersonii TaxID=4109 RepID=A0A9J5WLJ7_SOLCO|nr:hypothetical protein H5410_056237 [Solanum commersonii]
MQVSFIPFAWIARALIQCWGRKPILVIWSVLYLVENTFCGLKSTCPLPIISNRSFGVVTFFHSSNPIISFLLRPKEDKNKWSGRRVARLNNLDREKRQETMKEIVAFTTSNGYHSVPINTRSHWFRLDSIFWAYVSSMYMIFLPQLFAKVCLLGLFLVRANGVLIYHLSAHNFYISTTFLIP